MTHWMMRIINTVISLCLMSFFMSPPLLADERLAARIQIGLNLIPAVLAANKSLIFEQDFQLLTVYVVYLRDRHSALMTAQRMESNNTVRGHKLVARVISFSDLKRQTLAHYDALFINERMGEHLKDLIQHAQKQQVILFSPFKGDVENGVMSGFEVTNKVLPAVNMHALKNSNVNLKAFFLRIALKYDQ